MTDSDQAKIDLNPPALRPAPDEPWRDDALQRQAIAAELDKLVAELVGGAEPATIALDGGYGTGKTFILERWVQDMVSRGQVAAYYNAWENDCDDDPLVSLIETLASNDKTAWTKQWAPALNVALTGILHKYTGVDVQRSWAAANDQPVDLIDAARHRRASRQKLKDILAKLADTAGEDGPRGVVVVVDELDRCRPTFATELIERVKHVLNVPGLIFVFGVNMAALRETVRAAYGNIDAHQYLLRMFTTTLGMPRGVGFSGATSLGATEAYLQCLAGHYRLPEFCSRRPQLSGAYLNALKLLALVVSGGDFTLRESERTMWLLAKIAASFRPNEPIEEALPEILVPLAIVRIKDPDAYYRTVSRPDEAPAVIDSLFALFHEADLSPRDLDYLDRLEMTLYAACHQGSPSLPESVPPAYLALREFTETLRVNFREDPRLSHRLAHVTEERARALLKVAPESPMMLFGTLRLLTSRFDVVWPRDR